MPKRKLASFDPLFTRVTKKVLELMATHRYSDGPLFKIPMSTQGQSINLQHQLRQFWGCLLAEGPALPMGDERFDLANHPGLSMLAARSSKEDKKVTEIVHRSQLVTAQGIAQALGAMEEALMPEVPSVPHAMPAGTPLSTQEELIGKVYGTEKSVTDVTENS